MLPGRSGLHGRILALVAVALVPGLREVRCRNLLVEPVSPLVCLVAPSGNMINRPRNELKREESTPPLCFRIVSPAS